MYFTLDLRTLCYDTFPKLVLVLKIIKEAQQQHGLRHSDYQRYRFVINATWKSLFMYSSLYETLFFRYSEQRLLL
jgi:hypothetical protein